MLLWNSWFRNNNHVWEYLQRFFELMFCCCYVVLNFVAGYWSLLWITWACQMNSPIRGCSVECQFCSELFSRELASRSKTTLSLYSTIAQLSSRDHYFHWGLFTAIIVDVTHLYVTTSDCSQWNHLLRCGACFENGVVTHVQICFALHLTCPGAGRRFPNDLATVRSTLSVIPFLFADSIESNTHSSWICSWAHSYSEQIRGGNGFTLTRFVFPII